jgi:hypothetical protein
MGIAPAWLAHGVERRERAEPWWWRGQQRAYNGQNRSTSSQHGSRKNSAPTGQGGSAIDTLKREDGTRAELIGVEMAAWQHDDGVAIGDTPRQSYT